MTNNEADHGDRWDLFWVLAPFVLFAAVIMMPMLAVCVGQIFDYFVWEIFFMAFQSFFFAHFASSIYFQEVKIAVQSSEDTD